MVAPVHVFVRRAFGAVSCRTRPECAPVLRDRSPSPLLCPPFVPSCPACYARANTNGRPSLRIPSRYRTCAGGFVRASTFLLRSSFSFDPCLLPGSNGLPPRIFPLCFGPPHPFLSATTWPFSTLAFAAPLLLPERNRTRGNRTNQRRE
ncbi:hypothetical protein R1flu_021408 [Riccia fluitans]|uniref:Uncharacterized protein n=1 Tax=Riccia fluitans TaxID=41844 RepID=A0ABD1ZP97_9MARC